MEKKKYISSFTLFCIPTRHPKGANRFSGQLWRFWRRFFGSTLTSVAILNRLGVLVILCPAYSRYLKPKNLTGYAGKIEPFTYRNIHSDQSATAQPQ